MFTYPCGTIYSVTSHCAAQWILANRKVKGCLYRVMKCPLTHEGPITLCPTECACVVVKVLRKHVA